MPSIRSHLIKLYLKRTLRKSEHAPLDERRAQMNRNADRFKNAKGVSRRSVDVGGRPGEWLIPERTSADAAVLYLHGGAYTVGSLDSHRALASHIASAARVSVLLLDYRLAPEHPFPAALEDAVRAFSWIQETLAIGAGRIVVMGDSAGGGLALATALRLRDTERDGPRALICLSPWTDLSLSGESVKTLIGKDPFFPNTLRIQEAARSYAGGHALRHPEISPRFANLEGLPDLYIQVGTDEIVLSDSLDLAESAKRAGVTAQVDLWSGMWHVWQIFCDRMPESRRAIERIGRQIRFYLLESQESSGQRPDA